MRFLFVHQDYGEQAERLVAELGVQDVQVIIARKGSFGPTEAETAQLRANTGAEAAACELIRKYRKTVSPYVQFTLEPKKFRIHDQVLREWLLPTDVSPVTFDPPSIAFRKAAARTPELVLHPDALNSANDIANHRWRFASQSAEILERFAAGEALGAPQDWKAKYGVDFAPNGRVGFRYVSTCGEQSCRGKTEWHLKEGDNTSPEGAARIYFVRLEHSGGMRVVVFYVGPHPADGVRSITFNLS